MNSNLDLRDGEYTRRVFRQLGIEHYLKPRKYKASNERPNPFKHLLIE